MGLPVGVAVVGPTVAAGALVGQELVSNPASGFDSIEALAAAVVVSCVGALGYTLRKLTALFSDGNLVARKTAEIEQELARLVKQATAREAASARREDALLAAMAEQNTLGREQVQQQARIYEALRNLGATDT